jgi:tetratricopeptide (TPR) repeat protein
MLHESKKLLAESIQAEEKHQQLKAEALLADAVVLDPDNVEAWLRLGRLAARKEDRHRYLEKVLEIAPGNEEARAGLHAMQYPGGEAKFRRLIEQAHTYQANGQGEQALKLWRAVLKFDPVNEEATLAVMAMMQAQGRSVAKLLQSALRRNPQNSTLATHFAAIFAKSNHWQQVESVLKRIDAKNITTPPALVELGKMQLALDDPQAARRTFERAVALPGCAPAAHVQLGQLYEDAGQPDQAAEAYRRAVDESWGTPEATQAERRLREISPYLPRALADSWLFIAREALGWVVFIALLALFDSAVYVAGMRPAGVLAVALSLAGGMLAAVSSIAGDTVQFFGERKLSQQARQVMQIAAAVIFTAAVLLSLSGSIESTADYIQARFR